MPWCPKCKTEYENHVETCADCGVALVEEAELNNVINYELLAYIPESEVSEIMDYLKYSEIDQIKLEETEEGQAIMVGENQHQEAASFLRVYMKDRVDEDEEDYYFSEYETVEVGTGAKEKDLKSSGFSFMFIGGLLLVFGILNLLGIMTFLRPGIYLYVLTGIGVLFAIIGAQSYMKISSVVEKDKSAQEKLNMFMEWFESKYTTESYLKAKELVLDDYNAGSLYFVIIDDLKEDLKAMYPDEDVVLINSSCEYIYEKHFAETLEAGISTNLDLNEAIEEADAEEADEEETEVMEEVEE